MALIKCAECDQQISDAAAACPHCGAPQFVERKSMMTKPAASGFQLVGFLVALGGVFWPSWTLLIIGAIMVVLGGYAVRQRI